MKKWKTKCKDKTVRHGAKGYRIKPGTKAGDSYCARSYGIMKKYRQDCKGKDKCSRNCLSRKKWRCSGKKSRR